MRLKPAAVLGLLLAISCHAQVTKTNMEKKNMDARTFHTVEFQGGKNWQKDLPPEKQDLAGHFAMVKEEFAKGELLANGPLMESFHGFYVYDIADINRVQALVDHDEGLKKGVLDLVELKPWQVLIDRWSADTTGKELFVLDYSAGKAYARGKSMDQQDPKLVEAHMSYVAAKAASGMIVLGGPVDPQVGRGRYIVAAKSKQEAMDFVSQDPAVDAQLFTVDVKTWKPFQKQASKR